MQPIHDTPGVASQRRLVSCWTFSSLLNRYRRTHFSIYIYIISFICIFYWM